MFCRSCPTLMAAVPSAVVRGGEREEVEEEELVLVVPVMSMFPWLSLPLSAGVLPLSSRNTMPVAAVDIAS